jgi:hypothetical protein
MKQAKRIAAAKRTRATGYHVKAASESTSVENRDERVQRLYAGEGGPLVQWLIDEARRRRMDLIIMAREVGVTYGYIAQLRAGIRKSSQISHDFASACALFLGVPTIVVLLVSGSITMRDFAVRAETEEQAADRALRRMQDDPHLRASVPVDLSQLNAEGKKALTLLYADTSGQDIFGVRQLPDVVRWLQRAAELHDENEFAAATGHRDTSSRLP